MHISTLEEYGVRCALQLANHFEEGPVSASTIAEQEGLSVEYVSKIMYLFRKAGLVSASRGNQGGFYLSAKPHQVSIQSLFSAVGRPRNHQKDFCSQYKGQNEVCVHSKGCSIRPVWATISDYFHEVLGELTLHDLLVKEQDSKNNMRSIAREKAEQLKNKFKTIRDKDSED